MPDTDRAREAREWVYRPEPAARGDDRVLCCPGSETGRSVLTEYGTGNAWVEVDNRVVMATEAVR